MNKIKRPPLQSDQDNAEKAFHLISDLMNKHTEIEPTLWASAIWSTLIVGYINCGFTYEDFEKEMKQVIKHYKKSFDEHEH